MGCQSPRLMPDVRILRPHQDERTGRVLPPGVVVRRPDPEAESLRLSGIGEVMETAIQPRRQHAIIRPRERR